jgi:hypothetical protein
MRRFLTVLAGLALLGASAALPDGQRADPTLLLRV